MAVQDHHIDKSEIRMINTTARSPWDEFIDTYA